ncbi:dimeric dihydrodiol dehydrogenase [Fusarium sp. MPI-SDFR-AT-0072]|nr:dimeric dihydrodiol dehydrogenase [Fusarium sp. MPI-SDFR-AT-0072]KAI7769405.1 hypothetical protein LZL87_012846 [Fusarium oxysporum]
MEKPSLRWGIIGTGLISSWFVKDITLPRTDARAEHIISAIGSSSIEKGQKFVATHIPESRPVLYGSYSEVFHSKDVDIIYIGTPHALHKEHCLEAIRAHKHVLCEKPFTVTAAEAREVITAAQAEGVFVMEAMWTRFRPLVSELRNRLFGKDKVIGDVRRTFCDFGLDMNLAALGPDSRLKNPALGAGSLLDIGIYSLTWGLLTLEDPQDAGTEAEQPVVKAVQTISEGIDVSSTMVLKYPRSGRQGILTSTIGFKTPSVFCRIEGTEGYITVHGPGTSNPAGFSIYTKRAAPVAGDPSGDGADAYIKMHSYDFEEPGQGFYWEADAVALDLGMRRCESFIMPHAETLRVLEILDEVRRQGGARFPQDDCNGDSKQQ